MRKSKLWIVACVAFICGALCVEGRDRYLRHRRPVEVKYDFAIDPMGKGRVTFQVDAPPGTEIDLAPLLDK